MCAGGCNSKRSMTANIVAFAPMPSARTKTDANGKAWSRTEHANGESGVLSQRVEPARPPFARQPASIDARQLLPRRADVAVRRERAFARLLGRESARNQFGDAILEMKSDFLVHVARDGTRCRRKREEASKPGEALVGRHVDGLSSGALSSRSTAST